MIKYYMDLIQGSEEWLKLRCGLLCASEMKLILTPTLKAASNDKERAHLYELLGQRITKYVEPTYIGDEMLRGIEDEIEAKILYAKHYAPTRDCGGVTNDEWGFTIWCSPDALVGDDGFLEGKSRRQKFQTETIIECVGCDQMPMEYALQVQTGFLVMNRKWCDFISYCGGMHMATIRVYPDPKIQDAIISAASAFEARLAEKMAKYQDILASEKFRLLPTERKIIQDITV